MLMYLLTDNKTTQKILFLLQTLKPSQSHNSCVQFGSLSTGCTWVEVKAVNQNRCRLDAYPGKRGDLRTFFLSWLKLLPLLLPLPWPPSAHSVDSTAPPGLGKGRERRKRGAGNIFRVQYCCGLALFFLAVAVLKSTLTHGELCGLLEGLYPPGCPPALIHLVSLPAAHWPGRLAGSTWLPLRSWVLRSPSSASFSLLGSPCPSGGPLWQSPLRRAPGRVLSPGNTHLWPLVDRSPVTSRATELYSAAIAKFSSFTFSGRSPTAAHCVPPAPQDIWQTLMIFLKLLSFGPSSGECTPSIISSCGWQLKSVSPKVSFKEFSDY